MKDLNAFKLAAKTLAAKGNTHAAIYRTSPQENGERYLVIVNGPVPLAWELVAVFDSITDN